MNGKIPFFLISLLLMIVAGQDEAVCCTTRCSNLEEAGVYYNTDDIMTRECMFNLSTCICMLKDDQKTPCGPTAYNISVFLIFENAVNISSSTADNTNLRVICEDVRTSCVGKNSNSTVSNVTIMDCITPLMIAFKDKQYPLTQLSNVTCSNTNTDLGDGLNVTRVCRCTRVTTVDSTSSTQNMNMLTTSMESEQPTSVTTEPKKALPVAAIIGTSATIASLLFLVVIMITILIIVMLFKGEKRQSSSQNYEDNADTHSNTYQVINTSTHGESAGNVVEGGLGFVMTGHPDLPAPPLDLTSNLMTLEQWREQEDAVPNPFHADALPVDTASEGQPLSDPPDYETIPEANHNHFLTQRIATHSIHVGQDIIHMQDHFKILMQGLEEIHLDFYFRRKILTSNVG